MLTKLNSRYAIIPKTHWYDDDIDGVIERTTGL